MASITSYGKGAPEADVKLATNEQLGTIRRLAQIVARIFYEDRHIVLMDQLVSITVLPADVLAHRLGIQVKELGALASKLLEDKLICNFRRNETKDNITTRTFQRTYYYLDYKLFLDVTKWRMMLIRKKIDMRLRNELDNKGYVCPRCKKSYSTLEVAHLLDPFRNVFVCEISGCNTELVDNEEAEDVKRSKDSLMRFNEQLSTILDGLRRTEGITLPPLDVGAWLTKHAASQPWHSSRTDVSGGTGIPAPTSINGQPTLQVDLSYNDPAAEAARKAAKQKAEEEQRKQNALPAWHLASTVSGEQTSLGRKQERMRTTTASGYDDEKNDDEDADDDDYYAQYAAAEAATGAADDDGEDLGDFESVDTPNANGTATTTDVDSAPPSQPLSRKRSRSRSPPHASRTNGSSAADAAKRVKQETYSKDTRDETPGAGDDDDDGMDDFEDVV
ncbi:hypothetical protein BCV70DRAFT_110471 [Testicularia cyperi]|uniref:HTH TFE/IIEalpha-type domain-containing protein n=1 Tax=Testicularia cyperi TaxID=1882483 RepID=A0A317XNI1_9BASI|nr:hypothetical protein BCV70DRAFT_110471 [Testicularia cyperi]